jgi:hypothetical protein
VSVPGLRIPKQNGQPVHDPADVRAAQRATMAGLDGLKLAIPGGADYGGTDAQRRRAYLDTIRRQGFWATTADEKGMVLFVSPGVFVEKADGSPLIVPYPVRTGGVLGAAAGAMR